jgi:DnaJ-class molecular chaperone
MRTPYDVLGLKPTAKDDEIRKAFRRLAKKHHPDMNPGNKEAEAKFKDINAAYNLLSDPVKRGRFDRGEIDAEGRERFEHAYAAGNSGFRASRPGAGPGGFGFGFGGGQGGGGPGGGGRHGGGAGEDMSDLFSHLFGDRFTAAGAGVRMRGEDRHFSLTVDFLDAANGASRRITLPDGRSLDVAIPAGSEDGQTLRLRGQGTPGIGGDPAGDLLLKIQVAPHKLFKRVGKDIHVEIPVSLGEAVSGGRVTVPTVHGPVAMTVPPRSNTGTVLRLKGKGIKGGDQYVTLKVALPERIDDELARLIESWSARHPYDPRAGLT